MQEFLQAMVTSMELLGFAKRTQRTYLTHIQRFYQFYRKPPADVGYDEVRAFLHHAIKVQKLSSDYVSDGIDCRRGPAQYMLEALIREADGNPVWLNRIPDDMEQAEKFLH